MTKLVQLKKEWLKRPDVRAEYDALGEEFSVEALTGERTAAELTHDQVAKKT